MRKKIETEDGIAKLFNNGEFLMEVEFELDIYRNFFGKNQTPGLYDINGWILPESMVDSLKLTDCNSLVMELEDGRQVGIIATGFKISADPEPIVVKVRNEMTFLRNY